MGDGELQEGQIWEAATYAPRQNKNSLSGIVDRNGQQIDGSTAEVGGLGDLRAKFEAFGWHVLEADGNKTPCPPASGGTATTAACSC